MYSSETCQRLLRRLVRMLLASNPNVIDIAALHVLILRRCKLMPECRRQLQDNLNAVVEGVPLPLSTRRQLAEAIVRKCIKGM